MKTIVVNVTHSDIDDGTKMSCTGCPVVLGIRRSLGHLGDVRVGNPCVSLWNNGRRYETIVPPEASRFISNFDDGRPVSPFSFSLEVPEEALRAS